MGPDGLEGVQPGYGAGGQKRFGVPRLIVSTDIAVGRTVDPKVLRPSLDSAAARSTVIGPGVQYLNDLGDILAAPAHGDLSMPSPYLTLVRWQGTTAFTAPLTYSRCHAAQITNQRRMVGTGPEGWCLVDASGRYTIIEHAAIASGPQGWTIDWGTDAKTQAVGTHSKRYHASGVMALPARNTAGDTAVVLMRTDPER